MPEGILNIIEPDACCSPRFSKAARGGALDKAESWTCPKCGGTICMHAENGGVIDVLVKKALAEGKTAPKYHALSALICRPTIRPPSTPTSRSGLK